MGEVKYYAGGPKKGEPIPDGYYKLVLKEDPFNVTHPDNMDPIELHLAMRDYKSFTWWNSGSVFVGFHIEGHTVVFPVYNILYMELNPNSPLVADAIHQHNMRRRREDGDTD